MCLVVAVVNLSVDWSSFEIFFIPAISSILRVYAVITVW